MKKIILIFILFLSNQAFAHDIPIKMDPLEKRIREKYDANPIVNEKSNLYDPTTGFYKADSYESKHEKDKKKAIEEFENPKKK